MNRHLVGSALSAVLLCGSSAALADGAKIYASRCANCHGKDGKGETAMGRQKGAKDLAASKATLDEIVKIVTDGKTNSAGKVASPAFKEKLSAEDIKAVAEYLKATYIK
jgi:cytochrome c6